MRTTNCQAFHIQLATRLCLAQTTQFQFRIESEINEVQLSVNQEKCILFPATFVIIYGYVMVYHSLLSVCLYYCISSRLLMISPSDAFMM